MLNTTHRRVIIWGLAACSVWLAIHPQCDAYSVLPENRRDIRNELTIGSSHLVFLAVRPPTSLSKKYKGGAMATSITTVLRFAAASSNDNEDDREYEYVRRKGGRKKQPIDDALDDDGYYEKNRDTKERDAYFDEGDEDDEEDWDEDDWSDDDDDDDEYDLLGNTLIPNPLLDSMDPDGAAERFPELAKDPRFWFDMLLFVVFLDFLSFIGPRDPFPDIPIF